MRTLTREVVSWAGCPPCHQWGLAAHERVKGASRRARLPGTRHNKLARHGLSSDLETNNTTARPQQGTAETAITFAPENCTKNAHFSPAKAMAVSIPRRHQRAKATRVSDNRPPGRQGQAAVPAGDDDTTASQISHAIRLEEVSTTSENVAIPTLLIHDSKESRGNCMQNCWLTAIAGFQGDISSRRSAPRHHWYGGHRR